MNRFLAVTLVLACLIVPALATDAEKTWPKKGDLAFVSFDLRRHVDLAYAAGIPYDSLACPAVGVCIYTHLACDPIAITKVRSNKYVVVGMGQGRFKIKGTWPLVVQRTREDCEAARDGPFSITDPGLGHVRTITLK